MFFEDYRDGTFAAVLWLQAQKDELNCPELEIATVADFLEYAKSLRLSKHDKETIVEQAALLLDQFYAHLPFKRARYATDPVQRLRLIYSQLGNMSDLAFHGEIIQVFNRLRDAHTFYGLPAPFLGALAFLPFRMDRFHDKSGRRRYIVTDVLEHFDHPHFGKNAEITLWQGMPVDQAIEREAEFLPGGNRGSRFIRGLKLMTKRSFTFSLPPDEHYVVVQYISSAGGTEQRSIVLPWFVVTKCLPQKLSKMSPSSIYQAGAELTQLSNLLWRRARVVKESKMAKLNANATPSTASVKVDLRYESIYPHVFDFQYSGGVDRPSGVSPASLHDPANLNQKFGYIWIRTFDLDSSDRNASDLFVSEFTRILDLMQETAPDGLILDVRSNPGGAIDAAERILQLLTPTEITPANFHFINSRLTQQIGASLHEAIASRTLDEGQREWQPWIDDLMGSIASGHTLTAGRPLTDHGFANDTGQHYQGPVTLIIDALAYSATDIFAAGFQDHCIGLVIGVDESTGGGGANRWTHEELRLKLLSIKDIPNLKRLPAGAQMGLAIRRSSRVGLRQGATIEDEGVHRDIAYHTTRNDLVNHDHDLLRFACIQLGIQQTPCLRILAAELRPDAIALTVETQNLFRLECLIDGRPQCSFPASAPQPFLVPTTAIGPPDPMTGMAYPPSVLCVKGYAIVKDEAAGERLKAVVSAKFSFTNDSAIDQPDPNQPAISEAVSGSQ